EKKIPSAMIKESIDNVVVRWKKRDKQISGFSNFSYEVRKKYKSRMELNVNLNVSEKPDAGLNRIELFFNNYPPELIELKDEFESIYSNIKNKKKYELNDLYTKLLNIFKDNREIEIKSEIFMKNIAPELRNPEIQKKFRLNFIKNRFKIPDFDRFLFENES
ncbi:MAG: hypothetical protein ABFR75_11025, partial [Acidobacteriota bacterium]